MSKRQYTSVIRRQLNELNAAIDRRILRGRNYRDLARKHRELTRTLRTLERGRTGIFSLFFS